MKLIYQLSIFKVRNKCRMEWFGERDFWKREQGLRKYAANF